MTANNCNVIEKILIKKDLFQQKKQTLQDLTQSLNLAAIRCLCKKFESEIKLANLLKQGSMNKYMHFFKASLYYKVKHFQNMSSLSLNVLIDHFLNHERKTKTTCITKV